MEGRRAFGELDEIERVERSSERFERAGLAQRVGGEPSEVRRFAGIAIYRIFNDVVEFDAGDAFDCADNLLRGALLRCDLKFFVEVTPEYGVDFVVDFGRVFQILSGGFESLERLQGFVSGRDFLFDLVGTLDGDSFSSSEEREREEHEAREEQGEEGEGRPSRDRGEVGLDVEVVAEVGWECDRRFRDEEV